MRTPEAPFRTSRPRPVVAGLIRAVAVIAGASLLALVAPGCKPACGSTVASISSAVGGSVRTDGPGGPNNKLPEGPKARPKPCPPGGKAKAPKVRKFNITKSESPAWKKLKPHRGSIKSNGKTGSNARYYEWDYTHNDIEVYGPSPGYRHLGSMDPIEGDIYKGSVAGRNLRGRMR